MATSSAAVGAADLKLLARGRYVGDRVEERRSHLSLPRAPGALLKCTDPDAEGRLGRPGPDLQLTERRSCERGSDLPDLHYGQITSREARRSEARSLQNWDFWDIGVRTGSVASARRRRGRVHDRAGDDHVDVHTQHLVSGDRAEDVVLAPLEGDLEVDALAGRDVGRRRVVQARPGDLEGVGDLPLVLRHERVGAGTERLFGERDVEFGLDRLHRGRLGARPGGIGATAEGEDTQGERGG